MTELNVTDVRRVRADYSRQVNKAAELNHELADVRQAMSDKRSVIDREEGDPQAVDDLHNLRIREQGILASIKDHNLVLAAAKDLADRADREADLMGKKLAELLNQRDKLQADLEAAKVNAPELVIERNLQALQAEIDQASREQSRRELSVALTELHQLEADSRAMVDRLAAFWHEVQPEFDALFRRYDAARAAAHRWPEDYSTWAVSPAMAALAGIATSLAMWREGVVKQKLN